MLKTWLVATAIGAALLPTLAIAQTNPNAGVEQAVREAFADVPLMINVAKCESGFRQFSAEGVVLRGGDGKGYLGIFQIGEQLHTAAAAALGFDILTIEGNIAYAKHLYLVSGSNPWRGCLPSLPAATAMPAPAVTPAPNLAADAGSTPVVVKAIAPSGPLTLNLALGSNNEQVRTLQQLLNAQGFTITTTGGGSPGHETTKFSILTRNAVRRFQCAKAIICKGSETTTGYGRVGSRTRAALLKP